MQPRSRCRVLLQWQPCFDPCRLPEHHELHVCITDQLRAPTADSDAVAVRQHRHRLGGSHQHCGNTRLGLWAGWQALPLLALQ